MAKTSKAEERAAGKGSDAPEEPVGDYFSTVQPEHYTGGASQIHQSLNGLIKTVRSATDGMSALPEFLRDVKTLIAKTVTDPNANARGEAKGEGLSAHFASLSLEWAENLTLVDIDEDTARVLSVETRLTLSATSLSISSQGSTAMLRSF